MFQYKFCFELYCILRFAFYWIVNTGLWNLCFLITQSLSKSAFFRIFFWTQFANYVYIVYKTPVIWELNYLNAKNYFKLDWACRVYKILKLIKTS
jgi:hypothetical protein